MIYEKKNDKFVNYKDEEFKGHVMKDMQVGDKIRHKREKDGVLVEVEIAEKTEVNGFTVIRSLEREV